jgi:hypothetical protein
LKGKRVALRFATISLRVRWTFLLAVVAVALAGALPASAHAAKGCKGDDAYSYDVRVTTEGGREHRETGVPREDYVNSFRFEYVWDGVRLSRECGKDFESVELLRRGARDYTDGTAHYETSSTVVDTAGQAYPCSWTLDLFPEARLSLRAKEGSGRWRFLHLGGVSNQPSEMYRELYADRVVQEHENACPDRGFTFDAGINPPESKRRGLEIFASGWPGADLELRAGRRGDPPPLVRKLFDGRDAVVTDRWQDQATDPLTGFVETESRFFKVKYDRRGR